MSDNWNDGEFYGADGSDNSQNPIRALREKAESDSKTIKELKDELAKLRSQTRQSAVADLLKSKGLDPVVAELVPADVEPTPAALEEWYGKYGKVFASTSAAPASTETASAEAPAAEAGSTVPEEEQDALSQIMAATQVQVPQSAAQDLTRKMQNAGSLEELLGVIGQPGNSAPGAW